MTELVSIIIDNYNYARFLPAAIESALSQSYAPVEVVVVDDGSTDESRDIISRYEGSVIPVLKRNGGNTSAINAGVRQSRGEIICFLDADDFYYPDKVSKIVEAFRRVQSGGKPALVHHSLDIWDEANQRNTGARKGGASLSSHNLYEHAKKYKFIPFVTGPTSCISITRALADRLFPLPEYPPRMWADDFIVLGASLIGELHGVNCALGAYRVHGSNLWFNSYRTEVYECVEALESYLNEKLLASDRVPVMAFHQSMYCWWQLAKQRRWLPLFGHMVVGLATQRDRLTARFIYDTVRLVYNDTLGSAQCSRGAS